MSNRAFYFNREEILKELEDSLEKTTEKRTQVLYSENGNKVYFKDHNLITKNGNILRIIDFHKGEFEMQWAVPFYDQTTDNIDFIVWNDSSDTVTAKVRISDQSFKGAVTELTTWEQVNDPYQIFSTADDQITTETDGANNSPANAKFKFTRQTLGNTLPYVPEEITVTLGPDQWKIALLSMYVTKENGNYAGVDDDYMILSTETL